MTHARRTRLATRCVLCDAPLADSVSVEVGIGPTCRKRAGLERDFVGRGEANELTTKAAVLAEEGHVTEVLEVADALEAAGYATLAVKMRSRFVDLRVVAEEGGYLVQTPYSDLWNRRMWERHLGTWDRARKGRHVAAARKAEVWALMQQCFPGRQGIGPDGKVFTIPAIGDSVASGGWPPQEVTTG
jgi:hypothetical protein